MYKWLVILLVMFGFTGNAQELNCTVKINYDRITDANTQVFKTLERSLSDFVNNTRWTARNFDSGERIECSMYINISAYSAPNFTATLQVQSSRPIYNSTYSSPIFNFNDKDFSFRYNEGDNLFYNPNSFDTNNLVGVVAFYANIIIGMDADSFQKSSGTDYYEVAQNVASLGAGSGYKGWGQQEGTNQNRYFLVNDLLSSTYTPFRDALYEYHFMALDKMADDQKASKEKAIASIKTLSKVQSVRPNAFLTRVFFDAKSDEIVSMFSGGPVVTLTDLVDMLNKLSPTNGTKWSQIR
ncbi:type IX secretion system protein PorD [Flavobacterium hauense]